jgi:hypothetical protein
MKNYIFLYYLFLIKKKRDILFQNLEKYNKQLRNEIDGYLIFEIKKISSIYIGRKFTSELFIPYLEFSHENDLLYSDNIENK